MTIAIITSRFNTEITEALHQGCMETLKQQGIAAEAIESFWVPGALEIPLVAKKLMQRPTPPQCIIALGAVIKGDTYHFEVVCNESASAITALNLSGNTPILNGILTTYTDEQAEVRSGVENNYAGNKGADVALAAVELLTELAKI